MPQMDGCRAARIKDLEPGLPVVMVRQHRRRSTMPSPPCAKAPTTSSGAMDLDESEVCINRPLRVRHEAALLLLRRASERRAMIAAQLWGNQLREPST